MKNIDVPPSKWSDAVALGIEGTESLPKLDYHFIALELDV